MCRCFANPRIRTMVAMLLGYLLFGVLFTISLHGLQARQQGMGITQAVRFAFHNLWSSLPTMLGGFVVMSMVLLFFYGRTIPSAKTPVEAGQMRWQHIRRILVIGFVPILLVTAGMILYHLITGQWQDIDWLLVGMLACYTVVLLVYWRNRPGPERLYAMETGDVSRISDERMQQIQGKAAQVTINIFLIFLIFVGIPYETIVMGNWPFLTFIEFVILLVVWTIMTTYWNRRI